MSLTDEEIALIKRGTHPVSAEAMAWAGEQIEQIERMRDEGRPEVDPANFKSFDELRESVYRRFPHLRR